MLPVTYDDVLAALPRVHAVLADQSPPQGTGLRLHGHMLGESELWVYGTEKVRANLHGRFPGWSPDQ